MKLDKKKLDLENLDSIIRMCEDKMISPFRKKKEADENQPEEELELEVAEKPELSDLSDEDLEALMEALKDNKKG